MIWKKVAKMVIHLSWHETCASGHNCAQQQTALPVVNISERAYKHKENHAFDTSMLPVTGLCVAPGKLQSKLPDELPTHVPQDLSCRRETLYKLCQFLEDCLRQVWQP